VAELFGVLLTLVAVGVVLRLVLRRVLLVKYAVLWIAVSGLLMILAGFPQLLYWVAGLLGFAVPSNLLFFASIALLLAITLHHSVELSRVERRQQRLAEELALLAQQVRGSAHENN
jgi:hypothetical protein